jgi:subtilisin family serine protease
MAEYIVTVKEDADWQELHNELVANNIEVAKVRQSNSRSTHYHLTKPQADDLKNDARVLDIQLQTLTNNISTNLFQDQDFEKTNSNWGLIRHINKTNIFGNSLADPGNTYDYVLDGTGVDVVIVDTGIQADHPEFQDANGVSRVKTINWFDASGVSGTQSSSHYQDPDGHGTHVAGIVAGKTHGWAKNANIYAIKLNEFGSGTGISITDAFDCIRGWHDTKNGSRPTIVNCSWAYNIIFKTDTSTAYLSDSNGTGANTNMPAVGGSYRGVAHTDINPIKFRENYGLRGWVSGVQQGGLMRAPLTITSVDADIKQCIDQGVMFCLAASNENNKIVSPSNEDWSNYFTFKAVNGETNAWGSWTAGEEGKVYYMRGQTPNLNGGVETVSPGLTVGALDYTVYSSSHDRKASYSNTGDAVNIYAAGSKIKSAIPTNSTAVYNGTSMASPQMAGMCALLLQAHPDWTPRQVTNWFVENSQDKMYSSGSTDFTDNYSLLSGTARVAYFPLNGRNVFTVSGS